MKYKNLEERFHWVYGTSTFKWLVRTVNSNNDLSDVADGFVLCLMKNRHKILSQEELEEAVSKSFESLVVFKDRFEERCKTSTFAYTVLRNALINTGVSNQRHRVRAAMSVCHLPAIEVSFEDKIELVQELNICLETMVPELKEALFLDLEGLTYKDAAERQGVPIGTHRSRLFRAREHITKSMKNEWDYDSVEQAVHEALCSFETSEERGAP